MGDGTKSGLLKAHNNDILFGRGKTSTIEEYMSKQKKYEIYNSVVIPKTNKDTVQIFKVQIGTETWYSMKDYKCTSMQLKRIPKNILDSIGRNLKTKAFNLNKDNVNDMEILKRLQLSAIGAK